MAKQIGEDTKVTLDLKTIGLNQFKKGHSMKMPTLKLNQK